MIDIVWSVRCCLGNLKAINNGSMRNEKVCVGVRIQCNRLPPWRCERGRKNGGKCHNNKTKKGLNNVARKRAIKWNKLDFSSARALTICPASTATWKQINFSPPHQRIKKRKRERKGSKLCCEQDNPNPALKAISADNKHLYLAFGKLASHSTLNGEKKNFFALLFPLAPSLFYCYFPFQFVGSNFTSVEMEKIDIMFRTRPVCVSQLSVLRKREKGKIEKFKRALVYFRLQCWLEGQATKTLMRLGGREECKKREKRSRHCHKSA